MARRSDHSREEIKAMALAAAARIVASEGFAGLSARKIAKEIGYTVGTLYLVFENLDDLVLQLNGATLDEMYQAILEVTGHCAQPRECLPAMGHAYISFAQEHTRRWQMIFDFSTEMPLPAWYNEKINRMFGLVENQFVILLGDRSHQKAAFAARAVWCGVHGICALNTVKKLGLTGIDSVYELTDSLINNYLAGVSAGKVR